jgi:hypothetical protein
MEYIQNSEAMKSNTLRIKANGWKMLFFILLTLAPASAAKGGDADSNLKFKARAGYSIGGTAPIGMPATIRSIDSYSLTPSVLVGVDADIPLKGQWGLATGLRLQNKAMDAKVTTKGYRMELKKGESQIEGLFTGQIKQEVKEWMLTLPVQATFSLCDKLTLRAGPYLSLLLSKDFSGIASDGYIRQGDPTGPKIEIGDKEGEWATYDFSDEMRPLQFGVGIGADWLLYRGLGLSVDLDWGLTGIFKNSFKTVEQTLYPIYGTIGVFYQF